jgi:hypothetical protein
LPTLSPATALTLNPYCSVISEASAHFSATEFFRTGVIPYPRVWMKNTARWIVLFLNRTEAGVRQSFTVALSTNSRVAVQRPLQLT